MKAVFLSSALSWHTLRWYNSLKDKLQIKVYSHRRNPELESEDFEVLRPPAKNKLCYLFALSYLKKELKRIKPDILHAHYATSYGLLGALSGYHPLIVSAWGTDVFEFPEKSIFHRMLLKYVFKKADRICATSQKLLTRCHQLFPQYADKVTVIPFGIDLDLFSPELQKRNDSLIRIGTAKILYHIYQVDSLMKIFDSLCERYDNIRLSIAGDGPERDNLLTLKSKLRHGDKIEFRGQIDNSEVPDFLRELDIFVLPSRFESFGVAAVEASAVALPVVAYDVGGVPEVVVNRETGILAPAGDRQAFQDALAELIEKKSLRNQYGRAGRKFVRDNYDITHSVNKQIDIYQDMITRRS